MAPTTTLNPLARAALASQPDARLVVLAREGREDAFSEIVRRYRPGLIPFAAAFCPRDQAEDVVQESFTRAWRSLLASDSEIHLGGWLHTIVRNRALNARRDTRVHAELDETIDGVRQPSDIVLSNEELSEVVVAVKALPPTQREALVRSSLEGHSHDQIAASLGTTPGAVRQLIYRARHGLRQGFGMLIPLPVLRAMAEVSAGQATAGAGTAAGAAAVAGAGGGSVALKAATILALGATLAGSGIAIERSRNGGQGAADGVAEAAVKPADGGGERSGSGQSSGTASSSAVPDPRASTSGGGDDPASSGSSGDDGASEGGGSGPGSAAPGDNTSGGDSGSSRSGPSGEGSGGGDQRGGPGPGDTSGGGAPDGGGSGGPSAGGGDVFVPGPSGGGAEPTEPDGSGGSGPGPAIAPLDDGPDPLYSSGDGRDGSY